LNEEVLEELKGGAGGPGGVVDGFEAYVAGLLAGANMYMWSRLTIIEGRRSWNCKISISSKS